MISAMSQRAKGAQPTSGRVRYQVAINMPPELKEWLMIEAGRLNYSAPGAIVYVLMVIKASGIPIRRLEDFLKPVPAADAARGSGKRAG